MENKSQNNSNAKNNKNNNSSNHNPFLRNRNRKRNIIYRNNGNYNHRRRGNNRNKNQNVIKYNKPKNVIQRNFNQNNKNSIIRGKDLVISTNNQLVNQTSGIYCIIPINPLYWQGTRVKNMALQYQYYTPKSLSIEYVPTVSKFQPGTVTIGCISTQIINQETIQQTLISSTSGESFSCSEFFKKNIAINSLLQQKKLLLSSNVDKESVPFYIVVYLSGVIADNQIISPGSIYLNYSFEFFNPITETLVYKTENSIKIRDVDFDQQNISLILLEQNGNFGVGTKIDVEMRNSVPVYKYNNSEISDLDLERYVTALYSSSPDALRTINNFDLEDYNFANSPLSITLSSGETLVIIDNIQEKFESFTKIGSSTIPIEENVYYKVVPTASTPSILQNVPFIMTVYSNNNVNVVLKGNFINTVFTNAHN
jgi:hypothetical protein